MAKNSLHHLRALGALAFLITALFLSRHTFIYVRNTSSVHQDAKNDTSNLTLLNHTVGPISPFLNDHNHYHHHQTHFLRAALSEPFHCLVQKGADYWNQGVLPAFAGASRFPTPQFGGGGVDPLADSGWTSHEEAREVPRWWKDAFKAMKGKAPKGAGARYILLDQSGDFENAFGEQEATSAQYYAYYVPETSAVIMDVTWSPRSKLTMRRELVDGVSQPIPPEEILKRIPRMNQLSDLVWHTWTGTTQEPGAFRYYAIQGIVNTPTRPLMKEIFEARRGTTDVPWSKRLTFDLNSDEGKTLFASPNGIAVNWLLIHHATVLGKREPRVTIFNEKGTNNLGDNFCMVWDLIPEKKKGSFGKVEKEPKTKRGGPEATLSSSSSSSPSVRVP
ncbi:MAG: hypothetical protein Q9207_007781 [Kuettlingeria erythrocarpa]